MQLALPALGAGLVSALLFAAIVTQSPLSVALFYLATLPLFIVGLGWGWLVALAGAVGAWLALTLVLGLASGGIYFASVGAPAAGLTYLALLSRDNDGAREWYPIGRLVLWAAGLGAAIVIGTVMILGPGIEGYRDAVANLLRPLIAEDAPEALDATQREQLIGVVAAVLPSVSGALWLALTLLNFWLAARIVRASDRLSRPWPDIAAIDYPRGTLLVFALAVAASFLPGLLGLAGEVVAAVLTVAFALLGLAVVHKVSRRSNMRGLILAATYLAVFLLGWPLLIFAFLGMLEPLLRLRERYRPPTSGAG